MVRVQSLNCEGDEWGGTAVNENLRRSNFVTTRWSQILDTIDARSESKASSLAYVCEAYWYPLYAHARRRLKDEEKAKDAVQGFLADTLAREALSRVSPEHGRFRSFLLRALDNFLSHERDHARAMKRGGSVPPISIDEQLASEYWQHEPIDPRSPDRLYDRAWALMVLDLTVARLARDFELQGRIELFVRLREHLFGEADRVPYERIAQEANLSVVAVKSTMHRLRGRYRILLRAEVAKTLENPAAVDEELNSLFTILAER